MTSFLFGQLVLGERKKGPSIAEFLEQNPWHAQLLPETGHSQTGLQTGLGEPQIIDGLWMFVEDLRVFLSMLGLEIP